VQDVIVWSGWVGGIAVGLYMLAQYWITGQGLGVSTGYGNVCALGSQRPYFSTGSFSDPTNWRLWFVLGIPLGGFIALITSPGAELGFSTSMGAAYDSVLPESIWLRGIWLMAGGIMVGYGSRLAGGCTSGHAITGLSLLNPPSLVASLGFFVGGIIAVQLLFWGLG
jgi:uncharacterized membrane protein YedE/YeeE